MGLAPSSCLERVRRLQREGHLSAVRAEVRPAAFGVGLQAMVFVQLDNHGGDTLRAYQARLAALEAVVAVYHVAGRHDFVVHVVARDADHLRDLILDGIGHRDVRHVETALIFDQYRAPGLPDYVEDDPEAGG